MDKLSDMRTNMPRNYWKDESNQRYFLETLSTELGITVPQELGKLTSHDITKGGGRQLLRQYPSLLQMFTSLYPEHDWNLSSLNRVPRNTWKDTNNQKEFFDHIISSLNLPSPLNLAEITTSTIKEKGGRTVLDQYPSYFELLRTLYPDEDWSSVNQRIPKRHWEDIENVKEFVQKLEIQFNIQKKTDWYRISYCQMTKMGGDRLLRLYGGLGNILQIVYPDKNWSLRKFKIRDKRSAQWWLFLQISKLFPDDEVIEEYNHQEMTRHSGQNVELDIFIPNRKLAVEYHGIHHYKDTAAFGPIELYTERDKEKKRLCEKFGVELIVVPYWWDNTMESLIKEFIPARLLKE